MRKARDLWCLRKLIHCEGENVVNYIISYKCVFLDYLTPKVELETPNQCSGIELE